MCQSGVSLSWRVTLSVLAITLLLPDTANAQKQPVASEVPQPTSTLTGAIPPLATGLSSALAAPSNVTRDIRPAPPVTPQIKCVCFYVGKGRNGLQTPEKFSADLKRDKIPALLSPRPADARLEGVGNGP